MTKCCCEKCGKLFVADEALCPECDMAETAQMLDEITELRMELAEHDARFELCHKRTLEADKLWQQAHNQPNVWPDLGELIEWLMKRADDMRCCYNNCQARNTNLCSANKCSNYPPLPYCAEPDDRWPPQINACLREILRYRKQMIDPEGCKRELADAAKKAAEKPIKGSAQGGRKE
jgi:hypothetical protein